MSVKSVGWAIEQNVGNATKKLILVGICNHDGDGGSWPAKSTLARYAGCSERTVIRMTQELADEGWITIHKQGGGTTNTRADRRTNLYIVNYRRGDTSCHPVDDSRGDSERVHGVTNEAHGVTNETERGDIAMSPEPSFLNCPEEPSLENLAAFSVDHPARTLCTQLADHIEALGAKRPTITNTWLTDMDRAIRIDQRTPEQLEACIRWLATPNRDAQFWSTNILSPKKLRANFDKMALQARASKHPHRKLSNIEQARRIRAERDAGQPDHDGRRILGMTHNGQQP